MDTSDTTGSEEYEGYRALRVTAKNSGTQADFYNQSSQSNGLKKRQLNQENHKMVPELVPPPGA